MMVFLLFAILSSTSIYVIFKIIGQESANLKACLVINYFIASLAGFAMQNNSLKQMQFQIPEWLYLAALIGFLFVLMFYLIGISSQRAGITPTSLATRLSMIIPIFVSMYFFNETKTVWKYIAITIAIVAVILTSYQKKAKYSTRFLMLLPFILFLGSGSVDSLIKISQQLYIPPNDTALFSSTVFTFSLISATLFYFSTKKGERFFHKKNLIYGTLLGVVNFGSLYFMIQALHKSGFESSLLFGINNLAIIFFSVLAGILFFREKPTLINASGLLLAFIAIVLMIMNNQWS